MTDPRSDRQQDRLPPQSLEAEQAALGACLIDEEAAARCMAVVEPDDFYREAHRTIYSAIVTVAGRGDPLDPITVGDELRARGQLGNVGGGEYLTALMGEVPTTAHLPRYATIIEQKALKRRLIRLASELQEAAYDDPEDTEGLLNLALTEVGKLAAGRASSRGAQRAGDVADALLARLEKAMTEEGPGISAARTGIPLLDTYLGGLGAWFLVVPRGVEKSGKSMFAAQCALASALEFRQTGQVACCYVLEGQDIWEERALAWLSGLNSSVFTPRMFASDTDRQRFARGADLWRGLPLYLTGRLFDVNAIISDVRRIALREPVGLVLVDYAQLLQGGGGTSAVERAEVQANALAALAAELRCPVIVPSQLTDGDHGRHSKWARAWDEAATLVFDVERGNPGDPREKWQVATNGRLRIHASRRQVPFTTHELVWNLGSGHIVDGVQ